MTKPEKMVAEQLEQLGIKFEHNKFLYNKFFVDFFLDSGTIIEVFGDYWHFNPLVFKEPSETQKKQVIKDKSRIAYLEKCGHKVIVIWEKELKDDKNDKNIVNIRLSLRNG
jgi:G:T-mismatch repair DNA endonuclease (very short patch repair protein)